MASIEKLARKVWRAVELLVAPKSITSYSQAGEDLVLDFLTNYRTDGFYVDVGCNHPRKVSNSYRFYRRGWRGIVVDANADFRPEFRRLRPRDQFAHACVSDEIRNVDFHVFKGDALSSISGAKLYDNDDQYGLERVEKVRTRTLNEILAECRAPRDFTFLSIDVEGHDEPVLRSIDLNHYRPQVILIEANGTDFEVGDAARSWPARYLAPLGYELLAVNWSNLFFRLKSDQAPRT